MCCYWISFWAKLNLIAWLLELMLFESVCSTKQIHLSQHIQLFLIASVFALPMPWICASFGDTEIKNAMFFCMFAFFESFCFEKPALHMSCCCQCSANVTSPDIMNRMKKLIRIYSNANCSKTKKNLLFYLCSKSCTNQKSRLVNCLSLSGRKWCSACIAFLIDAPEASWKRVSYVLY